MSMNEDYRPCQNCGELSDTGCCSEMCADILTARANERRQSQAADFIPEMLDILEEVRDFLDNYIDVNDGEDGQPVPNRAMSLDRDIARLLARIRGERYP